MTDIIVCGASGRMGQRLIHLTAAAPDLRLVGATERPDHPDIGRDAGIIAGSGELGIPLVSDLAAIEGGDVAIAFTLPEPTLADAATCAAAGRPMVVGTTGFSEEELASFKSTIASIPWSPMSTSWAMPRARTSIRVLRNPFSIKKDRTARARDNDSRRAFEVSLPLPSA